MDAWIEAKVEHKDTKDTKFKNLAFDGRATRTEGSRATGKPLIVPYVAQFSAAASASSNSSMRRP